ncbi:MAG TPA: MFS transporter [Rhizomicrobium sp.]|nr:MFS transporter [Rhizomicrobium sp.]
MSTPTEITPVLAGERSDVRDSPVAPASSAYPWFVVSALALTNMVSYVERLIPTLLFAPIKKDFDLTDTQVSVLAGFAFVIFYIIFGVIIGRLADRSSRKRIIMIGIVFWSLATLTCGLARNFVQLFLARVSVGVGEATLGPSATSMISDYFPKERLARALSVYTGAQYVGAGLALVLGGFAIQLVSNMTLPDLPFVGKPAPWQMTFFIVGLVGMVVLIPMAFVKEPPRRGMIQTQSTKAGVPLSEVFGFIRTNWKTFLAIYGAYSIHAIVGFGTNAWVPSYFVRVHGWPVHDIGYAYGLIVGVLGTAGVLFGARFAEWLGARGYVDAYMRAPLIIAMFLLVPQALATLMPTPELSLALLSVSTFLSSCSVAVAIASLQLITPNQMRGQILSFYLFVANILGLGLGPTLVALITDKVFHDEMMVGYSLATTVAIITPIVIGLLWFGLKPYRESLARAEAWAEKI